MDPKDLTDDELILELADNIQKASRAKTDEEGIDRLKINRGQAQAITQQRQNALRQELKKREKAKP